MLDCAALSYKLCIGGVGSYLSYLLYSSVTGDNGEPLKGTTVQQSLCSIEYEGLLSHLMKHLLKSTKQCRKAHATLSDVRSELRGQFCCTQQHAHQRLLGL